MTGKIDDRIEEILESILPEAFAVVKETARRWAENGQLEVTAQDFDHELAQQRDGITIEGEKQSGITLDCSRNRSYMEHGSL